MTTILTKMNVSTKRQKSWYYANICGKVTISR